MAGGRDVQLLYELARGQFGKVYAGRRRVGAEPWRTVAVKVLKGRDAALLRDEYDLLCKVDPRGDTCHRLFAGRRPQTTSVLFIIRGCLGHGGGVERPLAVLRIERTVPRRGSCQGLVHDISVCSEIHALSWNHTPRH